MMKTSAVFHVPGSLCTWHGGLNQRAMKTISIGLWSKQGSSSCRQHRNFPSGRLHCELLKSTMVTVNSLRTVDLQQLWKPTDFPARLLHLYRRQLLSNLCLNPFQGQLSLIF